MVVHKLFYLSVSSVNMSKWAKCNLCWMWLGKQDGYETTITLNGHTKHKGGLII